MDTLLAGHRAQKSGPVSDAVIVQERESGQVEIDYAVFDHNYTALKEREGNALEGLVSRSFITIPAGVMDQLVRAWQGKYPEGIDEAEWTPIESPSTGGVTPARSFAQGQLSGTSTSK